MQIVDILRKKFRDLIINIIKENDEVKIELSSCEIILNSNNKISIYKRFIYDEDELCELFKE